MIYFSFLCTSVLTTNPMSITKLKRKRQASSLQPTHEHLLSCMYVTFFSEVEIAHSRENVGRKSSGMAGFFIRVNFGNKNICFGRHTLLSQLSRTFLFFWHAELNSSGVLVSGHFFRYLSAPCPELPPPALPRALTVEPLSLAASHEVGQSGISEKYVQS